MPTVELIYDADCPNVGSARERLLRAFAAASVSPRWSEYLSAEATAHARGLGSPTILVDGVDVGVDVGAEDEPSPQACCRVYTTSDGSMAGVPDLENITRALEQSAPPLAEPPVWRSSVAALPAIASALLPKVACPACWPAYAGFLGSFGLTFLMDARWLLPLTGSFLVIAVSMLGYRAKRRRGYGPLGLGVLAAALVLVGKFALESDPAMYVGIAILMAASAWNAWPRAQTAECAACVVPSTG